MSFCLERRIFFITYLRRSHRRRRGVSNNRGRNQEPEHVEKAEQKGVVDDDDG